jgi:ribosome-associated protein
LDLRQITVLADYFVLCTSQSTRQTQAILDSVAMEIKQASGLLPLHPPEGSADSGWALIDYGDVVVHVFTESTRRFYNLEQLWKDAPVVVKIQ